MKILITGSAGFIGYSLSKKLLDRGENIIGIDNHNNYYDTRIKDSRLNELSNYSNYKHYREDICDQFILDRIFKEHKPKVVVNLAAQAGVRYSIENPLAYINSNIVGFTNILENCRHNDVENLVYASTSSVYGANAKIPFSEHDSANHPLSIYAASKKSNELMAHTYSYLFQIPTTGLRFFTVYGPWGRPDMALFKFTRQILAGNEIEVFNYGNHTRDFTYIDDIIAGIIKTIDNKSEINTKWNAYEPDPATSLAPWQIFNIGNSNPLKLMDYISALEVSLNKKAKMVLLPLQPGDVQDTYANIDEIKKKYHFQPSTSVPEGVSRFVKWYKNYYKI